MAVCRDAPERADAPVPGRLLAPGDRVYVWGRHYTVERVRLVGSGREVQIVPDGRGASGLDWVLERYVLRHAHTITAGA